MDRFEPVSMFFCFFGVCGRLSSVRVLLLYSLCGFFMWVVPALWKVHSCPLDAVPARQLQQLVAIGGFAVVVTVCVVLLTARDPSFLHACIS